MSTNKHNGAEDALVQYNSLSPNADLPNQQPDLPTLLSASCWNETRLEILAWLRRNAASLAELYEGAVLLLYVSPLPGRVRFISLAVREIRNRLPEVISGEKGAARLDYKKRLDTLAERWHQNELPLVIEGETPSASLEIAIDYALYLEISALIKEHEKTSLKTEEAAFRLFEALAPENQQFRDMLRPVIRQWLKVTNWFQGKAHDSGQVDGDCDEQSLLDHFGFFETTLAALIRNFYSTVEDLDEILEDANS